MVLIDQISKEVIRTLKKEKTMTHYVTVTNNKMLSFSVSQNKAYLSHR
jgi:invasion protein IalB